jgi:hypothetical protein
VVVVRDRHTTGIWDDRVMDVEVLGAERLRLPDGSPVRAASAVAAWGGGHLVVSDDATHASWFRGRTVTSVRLLPPVDGHEVFDEQSGTKHLKPDLEAACRVEVGGAPALLLMGSGSSPARTRWCLLRHGADGPSVTVAEMAPVYAAVAARLGVDPDVLNMEGACVVDGVLRWFHRGLPSAGLPSGSVDLDASAAVAAALGLAAPTDVAASRPTHYDVGEVHGVGLAVTDVVVLPGGDLLVSAAAEDSPNPRDDGPVVASALARLRDDRVVEVVPLPRLEGSVIKVEGLMVADSRDDRTTLVAVTDVDDPEAASWGIRLGISG